MTATKQLTPAQAAWLDASPGLREGRAKIREALATDLHALGEMRAADVELQMAERIRKGEE